jgi:hypothetical protein
MCPDGELLSAYCDGEVPSPWRERIEEHIAGCRVCAGAVSSYRRIRESLNREPAGFDAESVKRRIGERLGSVLPKSLPFWKRRFSISFIAAAAAAAVVFGAGAGLTAALRGGKPAEGSLTAIPAKPLDVTVKVKDVNQLLDILNRQQAIREVTIQLPEAKSFEFRGEPIFLRENEYTRSGAR